MPRKFLYLLTTLLFLSSSFQICFSQNLSNDSEPIFQKGVVTVKLKERLPRRLAKGTNTFGVSSVDEKLSRFGATGISERFIHKPIPENSELPDLSRIYKIELPENSDIEQVIKELSNDPNVEYAEPVYLSYLLEAPNDSLYSLQSHLQQIHAEEAWDIHKCEDSDKPIIIGICDTGVKWDHPDLINNIWQNLGEDADNDGHVIEWADSMWVLDPGDRNGIDDDGNGYPDDFIGWNSMGEYGEDPSNPTDTDGHGTHVAGIAAAVTNNRIGVAGISWNAKIMTACQSSELSPWPGYIIDGHNGIIYLAEAGADIINCSWGSSYYSHASEEVIKYATMLGSIVVCAAGNSNSSTIDYPAKYSHTVAVAGVTSEEEKHPHSNYGAGVDVTAPYSILSTVYGDEYGTKNGTSMASPLVAGLLALTKSYYPDLTNEQLIERVKYTSDNIDARNSEYENKLGGGRINAYRALADSSYNVPQLFRLDIHEIDFYSEIDDVLEAGEDYSFNITVRNFSDYFYNEYVNFYLSTNDPDIEITKDSCSRFLLPNDYSTINEAFSLHVKESAKLHKTKFTITADSDIPVVLNEHESTLEVLPAGGIFVYESEEATENYSGTFFRDFFINPGLTVNYAAGNNMPSSLNNFAAVFLSCGTEGALPAETKIIEDYIQQGGKLYIEGAGAFVSHIGDKNLMPLLGIDKIIEFDEPETPFDTLYGITNTFTEGMLFNKSDIQYLDYFEAYQANALGKAVLTESNFGVIGIQNEGLNGQKTFCFSYPITSLYDVDSVSNRINLLSGICSFFDIPISFYANFETRISQGKAPFRTKFFDLSLPDSGRHIISRKWDFDNDGVFDSGEFYPEWTYSEPGTYTVTLEVSDGLETKTVTKNDYITVVSEENALKFNGSEENFSRSKVTVTSDSVLTLRSDLTLEAWINPHEDELSTGEDNIINKLAFILNINREGKFVSLKTLHDGSAFTYVINSTDTNSIVPGEWQHVAASYNALQKEVKIFINGEEQRVTSNGELADSLYNSSWFDLVIGNSEYFGGTFYGAIDEVRVWNTVRSVDEILEFMNSGLKGDEEGLVTYLPFNEGVGNVVSDYSVFNHETVLENTEWVSGVPGFLTSIESEKKTEDLPELYTLYQNYPNPFNPTTTISFTLPQAGKVTLEVYNILGERVIMLVNEELDKGHHSLKFNAGNLASGVYCYRLITGDFNQTKKFVLMK